MYDAGNRRKERLKTMRVQRRILLYESPNIIECRDINDVLGHDPFCRRRYWLSRQEEPVLLSLVEDYVVEFQQDWIAFQYQERSKQKLFRPRGINFHRRMPFMAFYPDRTIETARRSDKEVFWTPVIIETMSEPVFRQFEHGGISDAQINVLQHCLAVKPGADRAVLLGGCLDPLEFKAVTVARDGDRILAIEKAVSTMFDALEDRREPGPSSTQHCQSCRFYSHCFKPKVQGETMPELDPLVREWWRAEQRVREAQQGREAIEARIRHLMLKREEANCKSASVITFKDPGRWKVETERLLAERPEIVRLYRKTIPGRVLKISR